MRIRKLLIVCLAAAGFAGHLGAALAGTATATGKEIFNEVCAECHETADFETQSAADLTATIKKISAGQMKHKKALKLTDRQAAEVAAFMVSGGQ